MSSSAAPFEIPKRLSLSAQAAASIRKAIDDGASPDEFAIFYRTHAQSRVLEDALRAVGQP